MRTYIYEVKDLTEVYGEPAYGIEDTREGVMVSVWTDWELAMEIAGDLEWAGQ